MTSHVDMLPTLLEIAGAAGSERIQGRSFLRLLTDPCARGRERVFAEKSWHDNEYDPMRCIRTERYKFIRNFTEGFLYQIPLDIRRGEAGRAMEPLRRQVRALTELYDLQADPNETINLSGDPRFSEVEAELRTRLAEWMASTGDSLPARHIPWPQPGKEHFLNNMSAEVEGGIS
jgi:arylsulfatase A-like enzyme